MVSKNQTDLNAIHEENDVTKTQEELANVKAQLKWGKHTRLIQGVTALLSRDYKTPVKRLQHSYQEITALLSRDYKTPVKRL